MSRLFGTDGVRGVANIVPVSPEVMLSLGRAAVEVLASAGSEDKKPLFILGRDTRLSGPMLEAALGAGLCSAILAQCSPHPGPMVSGVWRTLCQYRRK